MRRNRTKSRVSQRHRLHEFVDLAFAVGELIDSHTSLIQQREMQVRKRRRLGVADVTSANLATGHENGQVQVIVHVRVAHAASIKDERMIEKRSVAVGSGL